MKAYKLFRLRADGSLSPLFIDAQLRVPTGEWMEAKAIRKRGFKFRPGWHAVAQPIAPHLSERGRVWMVVSLKHVTKYKRPGKQGGLWYTAQWLRVEHKLASKHIL